MKTKNKLLLTVPIILFIAFFVVANATKESSFKCSGESSLQGKTIPRELYLKLSEYNLMGKILNKVDARIILEIPQAGSYHYTIEELDVATLFMYNNDYPIKRLKGNFSKLSKTLAIQLVDKSFFDGYCVSN